MSFRRKPRRSKETVTYPLATGAYRGPTDTHATKLVAGIVPAAGAEVIALER